MNLTGNPDFDAAVAAAETARQAAMAGDVSQAQADAITLAYMQAVIAAGNAYGIMTANQLVAVVELSDKTYTPQDYVPPSDS